MARCKEPRARSTCRRPCNGARRLPRASAHSCIRKYILFIVDLAAEAAVRMVQTILCIQAWGALYLQLSIAPGGSKTANGDKHHNGRRTDYEHKIAGGDCYLVCSLRWVWRLVNQRRRGDGPIANGCASEYGDASVASGCSSTTQMKNVSVSAGDNTDRRAIACHERPADDASDASVASGCSSTMQIKNVYAISGDNTDRRTIACHSIASGCSSTMQMKNVYAIAGDNTDRRTDDDASVASG
eukprot:273768-Amphidinium_carterae.1